MAEADDHLVAELADAVRKRPQVAVVAAVGDLRDRGQGRIPLHDRYRAVLCGCLCERRLEGFPPAAVVPDEVRLLTGRLRELRDRLIGTKRPMLVDPQVRGMISREGGRYAR